MLVEIWTIPCFQDANVGEIRALWHQRYVQYKQEMTTALRLDRIDSSKSRAKRVNLKYKEVDKLKLSNWQMFLFFYYVVDV